MPPSVLLTGSHAYGTPNAESDIDLVCLVPPEVLEFLAAYDEGGEGEGSPRSDGGHDSGSFRFGKLNLICVTSLKAFDVWKEGTELLKSMAPVTREQACKLFRKRRQQAGLSRDM